MASRTGWGRRALTGVYRRLPARARAGASALLHGETTLQREAIRSVRAATSKILVEGYGDQVVGGPLHPHKAVTVTRFDAWEHIDLMRDAVVAALNDARIEVFELPNQATPVLAVSSVLWEQAWMALSAAPALSTYWAEGGNRRPQPIPDCSAAPKLDAFMIFQHLRSPHGDLIADKRIHIRLERWSQVSNDETPRVDGGFHERGTLMASTMSNTFATYLSPRVQERLRAHRGQPVGWFPPMDAVTEPVDIVYTWVDGSDPAWLAKRAEYDGSDAATSDALISARFENRDEIRYSLRSIEMYAGWYNRIFVVTDGQLPTWLNTDHPRLTVVDHSSLFEPSELPVFNSHAIESRLHHIHGLSESFIYMNDDFFFGRPVRPELFFSGTGDIKFFPSEARLDPDGQNEQDISVTAAAKNNRSLLEYYFRRTFTKKLKHTPYAHSKTLLQEMEQRFPEVFRANVAARFRTHNDHAVLSSLAQRYGVATGRASEGAVQYNYADISRPDLSSVLSRWLRVRAFDTFCLNDTGSREVGAKPSRKAMSEFLPAYFPVPSGFECD